MFKYGVFCGPYLDTFHAVNFFAVTTVNVINDIVFIFCSRPLNFIKKETLAQVFSCEFYEISKNTFFTEHLWKNASVYSVVFH